MSAPRGRFGVFFGAVWTAALGGFLGLLMGGCYDVIPGPKPFASSWEEDHPLPHHVPKYADGVSLRFAMVHDVIHERFPRHGKVYYQERNRRVRQELEDRKENLKPDSK